MSNTQYNPSTQAASNYTPEYAKAQDSLDLREFWKVLTRRKKSILTIVGVCLLLALLLSLITSPVYRATATLQIERESSQALQMDDLFNSGDIRDTRDFYETQFALIKSRSVIERVINELNLSDEAIRRSLFGRLKSLLTTSGNSKQTQKEALINAVSENLYVEPVRNSRLANVHFDAATPEKAAEIANAIANTFVAMNLERKYKVANETQRFLETSLNNAKQKLEESEQKLNEYARQNNIIDVPRGNGSTSSSNSQAIMRLSEELVEAQREIIMVETDPNSTQADLNAAKERAEKLRDILSREEQKALSVQDSMIEYNTLKREVATNQAAYQGLLEQLKQVSVAGDESSKGLANNLMVVDEAPTPLNKHKPNIPMNMAFAGLFGLILGIAVAFTREFIDDSVKDINDLERQTRLPVLGLIPAAGKDLDRRKLAQLSLSAPKSPVAEAFRSIATTLRFRLREDNQPGVMFVTSARPDEGKTTVAMNMANTFAQAGMRVLLIDADLRNPSLNHLLGVKNQDSGLAAYLAGDVGLEGLIQASTVNNLDIILAGTPPQNPSELLASQKMEVLLQLGTQHHDVVILDGPPVLGLADAMILSSLANMTVLVVQSGETRIPTINNSLKRLYDAGANMTGILLNRVQDPSRLGYGDDYYKYPTKSRA